MRIKDLIEKLSHIASVHVDELPVYTNDMDFGPENVVTSVEFAPSEELLYAWAAAEVLGKKSYTLPDKVLIK